jgi:hypothetical protein
METIKPDTSDIVVFSFAKYSQFKAELGGSPEYDYVYKILKGYLCEYQVGVSKIGFGGYIEDVAGFISYILKTYHINRIITGIEISDFDPAEFDPEVEPIILLEDLDSDQEEKN